MELKEIVVSKTAKVNLGNYESSDHFVSLRAAIDPLDDESEVFDRLTELTEKAIVRQLYHSYRVRGKKLSVQEIARHHGFSFIPDELK